MNSPEYCGKILFLAKGGSVLEDYHLLKDEVFYIQKGSRTHPFTSGQPRGCR